MVKHIRELWKGVKSLWGFRTQHYHNQNPHHLYHPNSVQRRGICWRYNGSLASLMVWCAEWERLITNNLKLANKCCAPPAASKMRSRLVIDFSLKGCDLVLRTACGVQNAFAFCRTGQGSHPSHKAKKIPRICDAGDCFWRRERDSNPRNAINAYTLSRRAPSATRTPLHKLLPFSDLLTSQEHGVLIVASYDKVIPLVSARPPFVRPKCFRI